MNRLITLLFILLSLNSIAQESWKKNGLIPTMSWGGISEAEISESSYRKLKEVGVTIDIAFFSKADAIAAGRVGLAIMKAHVDKLPASAGELHNSQIGWAKEIDESFAKWMINNVDKNFKASPGWPIKH
jgi:hypothetical protein